MKRFLVHHSFAYTISLESTRRGMDKYDHHKQFTILRIRPVLNDKMPRQGFVVGCYLVDGAVLFPSHATNRQDKQLCQSCNVKFGVSCGETGPGEFDV